MREASDAADYAAIANAIREAEAASTSTEIIPPTPLADPRRPFDRANTRLIAFPTAAIEDAQLAAPLVVVAHRTKSAQTAPVETPRVAAKSATIGSLAGLSRGLNALLVTVVSAGGLTFGGAMGPQLLSIPARHLELSSIAAPADLARRYGAELTSAGMTAAWLELRQTSTATVTGPTPALARQGWRDVGISEDAVPLVRVASIALAARTDVPPVIEITPVAAELLARAEDQNPAAATTPPWATTTVPAVPLAGARATAPQNRPAPAATSPPGKPSRNAQRAPQDAKRPAPIATPSTLGATRAQAVAERPARQAAKNWSSGAFESSR